VEGATGAADERVNLADPTPGDYLVIASVYAANPATAFDVRTFAVVPGAGEPLGLDPALTVLDEGQTAVLRHELLDELFEERYADPGRFGGYLGADFSWDLPAMGAVEGALSGNLGLGYFPKGGLNSFFTYGIGLRFYYDPLALELASNDRDLIRASLLYLW